MILATLLPVLDSTSLHVASLQHSIMEVDTRISLLSFVQAEYTPKTVRQPRKVWRCGVSLQNSSKQLKDKNRFHVPYVYPFPIDDLVVSCTSANPISHAVQCYIHKCKPIPSTSPPQPLAQQQAQRPPHSPSHSPQHPPSRYHSPAHQADPPPSTRRLQMA